MPNKNEGIPVVPNEWKPSRYSNDNMGNHKNTMYESGVVVTDTNEVIISVDMQYGSYEPNPLSFHIPCEAFLLREESIREYQHNRDELRIIWDELWKEVTVIFTFFCCGAGGEGWEWKGRDMKPFRHFFYLGVNDEDLLPILEMVISETIKGTQEA